MDRARRGISGALNPQDSSVQDLAKAMRSRSAKRRFRAAAQATIPSE